METASDPKPKRRWYQFHLRHLFVLTTVAAIACSWFACKVQRARERKTAVDAIEKLGGSVWYEYQIDAKDNPIPDAEPPGPAWFRNLVGLDFLADVVAVNVMDTQISDGGLERLRGLTKLKYLGLANTQVTDAGLEHLKALTKLEYLKLANTQVTDAGVGELQQALPKCCICRWQLDR